MRLIKGGKVEQQTRTVSKSMNDMSVCVGVVCVNALSMCFIVGVTIWCMVKIYEALFGPAFMVAR